MHSRPCKHACTLSNGSEGLWEGIATKKKYTCRFENVAESALKACCLVEDAQGRCCCESIRGWFWSTFYFVSWFFMTIYASLSKYLSKNVQVVIQVVNNKKVMAKTPQEANLYGNWCVRKGLNLVHFIMQTCIGLISLYLGLGRRWLLSRWKMLHLKLTCKLLREPTTFPENPPPPQK